MKRIAILFAMSALAACQSEAEVEPVAEEEVAAPQLIMAPDGEPLVGSFETFENEDQVSRWEVADDRTFSVARPDGTNQTGSFIDGTNEGEYCTRYDGVDAPPSCFTQSDMGDDGSWRVNMSDGTRFSARRIVVEADAGDVAEAQEES